MALTVFALILATAETPGFTIRGMASWVATTLVVWLVTTIGAVSLPELFAGPATNRDDLNRMGTGRSTE